jgi:NAD(P)-dependent dehydrogenase (short-subunit alcohol dehydrogenase family)
MNHRMWTHAFSLAPLLMVLIIGCSGRANREVARSFVAQFEKVAANDKESDDLEKQANEYNNELDQVLHETNPVKRAKAFGAWVTKYRGLVSQDRSILDTQSSLIDGLVADSAKFHGDANRYARESTDALREYLDAERSGIAIGEQMLAEIETYVDKPETADPKALEELAKQSEVLDSKSKAAFQRAKDAMARLRTVAL